MKKIIKDLMPPALFRLLRPAPQYGYFGNYRNWDAAANKSTGYDENGIFEKVKAAALQVKSGGALFERDSMIFHEEEVNPFLLSMLMWVAAREHGRLAVTDFGGSLGSTYFQHKKYLDRLPELSWSVVEQSHFTAFGKLQLTTGKLAFFNTVEESMHFAAPQVLLLSSVMQYLRQPLSILSPHLKSFPYVLFDRTGFTNGDQDVLTIQKVNPKIYKASYPAWFFSEKKFLKFFEETHQVFSTVRNDEYSNRDELYFKGYFFIRKDLI